MSQGGMVLLMRCWGFQWYTGISWCRRGMGGCSSGCLVQGSPGLGLHLGSSAFLPPATSSWSR